MPIPGLLIGIALPWLAGALAMKALAPHGPRPGAILRAAGFGWFFGVALVALGLRASDAAAGAFSWWGLAVLLSVLAAGAAWRLRRHPPPGGRGDSSIAPRSWLAILALGLGSAHVLFSGLELVTQPVFPWDGWTVWVYRAKAWFYAAELAPIVSAPAWLAADSAAVFTTPAAGYPLLPSLVTLWAGLSLGEWHEALVNLPTLAAGIAIALGLAGCLRGAGVGVVGAAISAYLLLSTPLFGVHMSLGGYADIWLAGFAGLGMTALLWGLVIGRRAGLVIGFVLLLLGAGVKAEGLAWLAAAVLVTALAALPWRLLAAGVTAAVLVLAVAALTGWTLVEIPGVGAVGFRDGHIHIPIKGMIRLEAMDVGPAYLANAFLMGNWNLLWIMVLATVLVLIPRAGAPLGRAGLAFFVTFVAMQAVIFGMTTEGTWAQDYTAINRMPLQMLPAVIFLVVLTGSRCVADSVHRLRDSRSRRRLLAGATVALVLTGAGLLVALSRDAGPAATPAALDAETLRFVAGNGGRNDNRLTVNQFQGGIALLSSGPVNVDADDYPLLFIDFDADLDPALQEHAPAFFWRRADQTREVSRITLSAAGPVDLRTSPDWRGRVVETGFFFPESGGPVVFNGARLDTDTVGNRLALLLRQWTRFDTWTQQSAHFLHGGSEHQAVSLTALVTIAALVAALIGTALLGRAAAPLAFSVMLLAGWLVLDARWGWDRVRQAQWSAKSLATTTMAQRQAKGETGVYFPYLERLRAQQLGDRSQRVYIVPDPLIHRFYGLRAKYQLLPHSADVGSRVPPADRLETIDYVLFLGPFTGEGGAPAPRESASQRWRRLGLAERQDLGDKLELVEQDPQGALYRVR